MSNHKPRYHYGIDVVFDGPPAAESGRFVEVEHDGASVNCGEWVERPDGTWALHITAQDVLDATVRSVILGKGPS